MWNCDAEIIVLDNMLVHQFTMLVSCKKCEYETAHNTNLFLFSRFFFWKRVGGKIGRL